MNEKLRRVLRRPSPPVSSDHRDRLEQQLLARFEAQVPAVTASRRQWPRYALATTMAVVLLTATQAPAEIHLEVGKRITVELAGDAPLLRPLRRDITDALQTAPDAAASGGGALGHAESPEPGGPHAPSDDFERTAQTLAQTAQADATRAPGEVSIRIHRRKNGPLTLYLDVWGHGLRPDAEILKQVKSLLGDAAVRIEIAPLRGRVQDTVLGKLQYLLRRHASPEELERARQQVVEELRRQEGSDTQIEVEIENPDENAKDGERHRIRVRMKKPASESR